MTAPPSQSETPRHAGPPDGPWGGQKPRQPLFNAFPSIVLALSAAIVAATAAQLMGPPGLQEEMMRAGALIGGAEYRGIPRPLGPAAPLVLHVFLHGGWLHLFMNMTAMVAFGPTIALSLGRGLRGAGLFLAFFFVCAIGGGLAQLVYFQSGPSGVAIGASSALSGFLPAVGYLQRRWRGAVSMSVPWVVINLILALTGGFVALPIAWAAHLGGLAAGFLFPAFLAARR